MEITAQRLIETLQTLGKTADQVAATLKAQGIQGVRNTVRILNPIVRYVAGSLLISSLGMDLTVPDTFRVTLLDGTQVEARLPQAIQEFLEAFNEGAYPEWEIPSHVFDPED
jgi:hypothetical protein